MSLVSVKDLCEQIWQLEAKHNLLDYEIDGVKFWQASRMAIYYDLARLTGVLAEPHPEVKLSFKEKCQNYLNGLFFANPYLDRRQQDVLIIDHCRKVKAGDEFIDIYTQPLIEELQSQGVKFEVYEGPNLGKHLAKRARARKYLDIIHLFFRRYAPFIPIKISNVDKKLLFVLQMDIKERFGIDYDITAIAIKQIKNFKVKYWFFRKLLILKRPKRIYVVVAYGFAPLIKAAKDRGIETVELQHGTFSDYHLGYSYPNRTQTLDYFPDKFWVWSEFWRNMCQLPLSSESIKIYPFQHLEKERIKYELDKKKQNQILIISQGALGERIAQQILDFSAYLKNFKIIYRLHPSEFKIWQNYSSLMELKKLSNVEIFDNGNVPLYQQLAESKYVIGVFSTVMYEALEFDCELLLLNLPGIEYMKNLIQQGKARFLSEVIGNNSTFKEAYKEVMP